tara:strand:- start:905 stop:1591 length:687 start_codon:yes stop_codon:yes gene_type:complete
MANVKEYAFYIEGTKLCIVERDTQFDNDVNSRDYGPGVHRSQWKSPKSAVADGIQLQYTHTPEYFINETNDVDTQIDSYKSDAGYLVIRDTAANDYTAAPESLGAGTYIVLKKAGKFNGLHKVKAVNSGLITLETKYSGSTVYTSFEETVDLYYNVDVLNDESDEIPLPSYLEKALVYYVKAKLAEDAGEFEAKEYFMREYKKITEKYESSLKAGARMIATPGPYAVR